MSPMLMLSNVVQSKAMNFFKKMFSKPSISDSLFGELQFNKPGYWRGEVRFEPIGQKVEVIVTAGADGPTPEQREFFAKLVDSYKSEVEFKAANMLHDTFTNWQAEFPIDKIWDEFELSFINLSNSAEGRIRMELGYSCQSDDHSFDIEFWNFEPKGITLNG